jgi:hypothetical protein
VPVQEEESEEAEEQQQVVEAEVEEEQQEAVAKPHEEEDPTCFYVQRIRVGGAAAGAGMHDSWDTATECLLHGAPAAHNQSSIV